MGYCLILAGPLYSSSISHIITMCKSVPSIVSTWDTESEESISLIRQYAAGVVLNSVPEYPGVQHVNYANKSICAGIKHAKEMGYTHVMRFRTDFFSPNIIDLCNIFSKKGNDHLVALCWFNRIVPPHAPHGYIMDHIMFGPCDLLYKYRSSYQDKNDSRYTEIFLQDMYFNTSYVSYEDVKHHVNFVLTKLIENDIKLYYTHHRIEDGDLIARYNSHIDACIAS